MPVKPPPLELRCPQCGWRQVWQPASDALTDADQPPACCPRCQHADLEARTVSAVAAMWWQRLGNWLTRS